MKAQKWVHMDGYEQIWGEETGVTEILVYTNKLDSEDEMTSEEIDEVIDNVVLMHNDGKDLEAIDEYLMDEPKASQEFREELMESLYENYYSKI